MNKSQTESILWRLATVKGVLYSAAALWTAWATATNNINMPQLGWWDWVQTIGGCFASWALTMMAFIDKSASQISAGRIPILENGHTQEPEEVKIKQAP